MTTQSTQENLNLAGPSRALKEASLKNKEEELNTTEETRTVEQTERESTKECLTVQTSNQKQQLKEQTEMTEAPIPARRNYHYIHWNTKGSHVKQ